MKEHVRAVIRIRKVIAGEGKCPVTGHLLQLPRKGILEHLVSKASAKRKNDHTRPLYKAMIC
jgi:hypothetical protein